MVLDIFLLANKGDFHGCLFSRNARLSPVSIGFLPAPGKAFLSRRYPWVELPFFSKVFPAERFSPKLPRCLPALFFRAC